VPHLLELLLKRLPDLLYIVWLDNLFSSTKLFGYLQQQGFGVTGIACSNSGICTNFVSKKQADIVYLYYKERFIQSLQ
jgi:hypothetical protein